MNRRTLHILVFSLAMLFAGGETFAQLMPERRLIRKGNRDYEKGNYAESEIGYLRAKGKDSLSFAAGYNLGNAYYKQGRFAEAAGAFAKPAPGGLTPELLAHNFYNAGNAQFQQRKLEEAIESYKQSLRLNPGDVETKFNLAYAKKLLENDKEQQQNDQNKDNKDNKDQQDQQDRNNDQQQNQDKQQGGNDKDRNNGQDKNDRGGQDGQQGGMTKEEAEQMLQAIEMGDEKTKEKVDAQKGRAVGGSSKNW